MGLTGSPRVAVELQESGLTLPGLDLMDLRLQATQRDVSNQTVFGARERERVKLGLFFKKNQNMQTGFFLAPVQVKYRRQDSCAY